MSKSKFSIGMIWDVVSEIVTRPIRRFKSYVRKQIVFGVSLFLGALFLLLSLADFLVEVIPSISRWVVLLCIGILLILVGYLQKVLHYRK